MCVGKVGAGATETENGFNVKQISAKMISKFRIHLQKTEMFIIVYILQTLKHSKFRHLMVVYENIRVCCNIIHSSKQKF